MEREENGFSSLFFLDFKDDYVYNDYVYNDYMYSDYDVDDKILEERKVELDSIENEMYHVSDILKSLYAMIGEQGENLDIGMKKVEESKKDINQGTDNLAVSEEIDSSKLKIIRDAVIITGGVVLGGLGFFLSPIRGCGTLISGTIISIGGVLRLNKK